LHVKPSRPAEAFFELDLAPPAKAAKGAASSLFGQIRAAILDGRLAPGTKLPPTRSSAKFFGLSRNTTAEVYDGLRGEGLVVTRRGAGTYVADFAASAAARAAQRSKPPVDVRLNDFWLREEVTAALGFWRGESGAGAAHPSLPQIDFRPAIIDAGLFPFDALRRAFTRQLRHLEKRPGSYQSAQGNQGNYRLRDAITRHISLTRAVACRADDVLITAGAQQAFDLLARVLVKPSESIVAIEDPGYPPMRVAFAAAGARLVPVGVDKEGLVIEDLPAGVSVICVCPSHQFPLGVTMSKRRRQALIEFARQRGAVIIEDDYDGEFRYDGNPQAALRSSDVADVVFYVGTFSKCMLPSLRLGFIVASDWAMPTLVAAKNSLDWHCSTPVQLGVAGFVSDGSLRRHVGRLRGIYKERRQLLLDSLDREFTDWLTPIPSSYGMHVTAVAHARVDLEKLTAALARSQVNIHSLRRYYLGRPTHSGLVFGYGAVDLPQIREALATLRKALAAAQD
jgi:GntR family transcriptional regulator / MocR family aminotransferase